MIILHDSLTVGKLPDIRIKAAASKNSKVSLSGFFYNLTIEHQTVYYLFSVFPVFVSIR